MIARCVCCCSYGDPDDMIEFPYEIIPEKQRKKWGKKKGIKFDKIPVCSIDCFLVLVGIKKHIYDKESGKNMYLFTLEVKYDNLATLKEEKRKYEYVMEDESLESAIQNAAFRLAEKIEVYGSGANSYKEATVSVRLVDKE